MQFVIKKYKILLSYKRGVRGERRLYMKITLFRKVRTTKEGKKFDTFITKLYKKDGSEITASVKFSGDSRDAFDSSLCPYNIIVDKQDANLSKREITDENTGETHIFYTLWVKKYIISDEKFVDHSLDDFI